MRFGNIRFKLSFCIILVYLFFLNPAFASFSCFRQDTIPYGDDVDENLLIAAYNNDYYKVLAFITAGAKVNTLNEDGYSALLYAVEKGNFNIVKFLVSKGADVNLTPDYDCDSPPLVVAAKRGYSEIFGYLLDNKAKIDKKDCKGASALHYSAFYNDTLLIRLLLRYKVNVNDSTYNGETPIMMAASNGSLEAVNELIKAGADVNKSDLKGFTPLMLACQNGHYEIALSLLQNWAEINKVNKEGFSSLSLAIMNRYPEVVDLLVLNGADVNETNSLSLNPLSLAKISQQSAIKDSLKKAGAKRNFLPYFYNGGFGITFNFNNKDFLMGFNIPVIDAKFNLESSLHYYFRTSAVAILQKTNSTSYEQFWERRHIIGIGLTKNFFILKSNNNALGINAGANYDLHFGKYRGTNITLNSGFKLSPCIGLVFKGKAWDFKLQYNYAKLNVTGLKNWYIGMSVSVISFRKPDFNKNLNLDL
jgi:ankyrin repeat protein